MFKWLNNVMTRPEPAISSAYVPPRKITDAEKMAELEARSAEIEAENKENALAEAREIVRKYQEAEAAYLASPNKRGFERVGKFVRFDGAAVKVSEIIGYDLKNGSPAHEYVGLCPYASHMPERLVWVSPGKIERQYYVLTDRDTVGIVAPYELSGWHSHSNRAVLSVQMDGIAVSTNVNVTNNSPHYSDFTGWPHYRSSGRSYAPENTSDSQTAPNKIVKFTWEHYETDHIMQTFLEALEQG